MCKEEIYININISFLVSEFLIFVCGIQQAKKDVEPFIHDTNSLNIWSADFFKQITEGLITKF